MNEENKPQSSRTAKMASGQTVVIADVAETVPLTMLGNLACPFCGSTNLSFLLPKKESKHGWIMCEMCGATGPNQAREKADVWWNKRAFGSEIFVRPEDAEKLIALDAPPTSSH